MCVYDREHGIVLGAMASRWVLYSIYIPLAAAAAVAGGGGRGWWLALAVRVEQRPCWRCFCKHHI